MRLPIPIYLENTYDEVEVSSPSAGCLADTRATLENSGNYFLAIKTFLAGCIESIGDIDDPVRMKSLLMKLPIKSAEYLAQEIMVNYYKGEDYVEGIYPCPRCGDKYFAQLKDYDGAEVDTRDRISDLIVNFKDGEGKTINIDLTAPVEIKSRNGEVLELVNSLDIEYPTLEAGIKAYQKIGNKDIFRLQFAIYGESLTRINDTPIDARWKNSYGMLLFESIKNVKDDLNRMADEINQYGVDYRVDKTCKECGKVWRPLINTSNFFVSALQSI